MEAMPTPGPQGLLTRSGDLFRYRAGEVPVDCLGRLRRTGRVHRVGIRTAPARSGATSGEDVDGSGATRWVTTAFSGTTAAFCAASRYLPVTWPAAMPTIPIRMEYARGSVVCSGASERYSFRPVQRGVSLAIARFHSSFDLGNPGNPRPVPKVTAAAVRDMAAGR